MIKIRPTTASGLTGTAYALSLPDADLNLKAPRPKKVSTTLSGTAAVSTWAKSVTGTETSIEVALTDLQYSTLRLIDEHQTVTEWVLQTQGRTFTVSVDVLSAVRVFRFGVPYWQVIVSFVIVSELHR